MKTENQTMSQTASSPMTNSFLSTNVKYGGLVKRKMSKRIRNGLFLLIGYIDTTAPHFMPMHTVITFFRFFQFLGPALFAASFRFWPEGEIHQKIVSYVSIVFHIVPAEYRYEASIFIEIIYWVIIMFYFILMISAAIVYKEVSKLPKFVIGLIAALNGSVMYLIHPIALQMASQELSRIIMGLDTYVPKTFAIVGVVITYLFAILYAFAFAKIMSITLLFRPTSFLTTLNLPQLDIMLSTYVTTILTGLSTHLSRIPYIIVTIIAAIFYFLSIYMPFMPGSFVRSLDSKLIFTACATGGISCLIVAIFAILDKTAPIAILFVTIALFVIIIIVSNPVFEFYEKKCLLVLDSFADDQSFTQFKNQPQLLRYTCVGYKYAHPSCLDWSAFKMASEMWSESSLIWATFGKFVAIYPEENNLLTYIIHNIETKKLKGNFAKQTIAQGRNILTQRETSLSPELKRKLQHVGKTVHHCKRKMRHIWDIVIQGNTHEMEGAVNNAYTAVNKTEAEFIHVLIQYPNNRFIARAYARFLQEIKADQKGFQEWVEKVKILQRGQTASVDNTNVLGVEAFPNLPRVLSVKNDGGAVQMAGETESAFQLEVDIEDEQVNEQMSGVRDQINSLRIPSLCFVSTCSILSFLILVIAPVIVIFVYSKIYIDSLDKPMEFLYHLSYLRTLSNQLPAFSFHSLFEDYPNETNAVFRKPNYTDIEISSLGYHKDTKEQYKYLIQVLTTNLEAIGQFRAFGADEELLKLALDQTYKSVLNYQYYTNFGNFSIVNVSIQSALMDYSIQLSKLSQIEKTTDDILKTPIVMNPIVNTQVLNNAETSSIECIVEYLRKQEKDMQNLMMIVLIVVMIFFVIYYIVLTIIELKKVQSNKTEIYSCLTSLPKNVVSGLAEQLRVLKKDTEGTKTTEVDTEMSKQQDNILKLFAAAGDSNSSISSDRHVFVTCNVLILIMELLLTFFLTQMFNNVTNRLVENGPHLSYVFGSIAYMMEIMNTYNVALAEYSKVFNYSKSPYTLLKQLDARYGYFKYFYQNVRYGGPSKQEPPFPYFQQINNEAMEKFACENEDAIPITYKDIYTCFTPDQQATLFLRLVQNLTLPVILNESTKLNTEEKTNDDLWYLGPILLFEAFFHPMFDSILPKLKNTLDSAIPDTMPIVIVLVIFAFIFVVVINAFVAIEYKKLKFALSLLLHCQHSIIMQTQKIIDVLNGHFTSKGHDTTTRNQRFFTEVVSNLPDSIITANNQMIITSVNKSTERIYGVDVQSLIGSKITDFLSSSSFSEDMTNVVTNASAVAEISNPTQAQYKKDGGSINYLELSCITFNQNYVLTTRDVTRMFVYNTLIDEERGKSDKLLASILPPSLVVRVQKGEKNISFAVQSATILFLDIVSFTPWCASNTAQMVMSTLNNMFKLLDLKLATHSTATKIKCIGDCYMCAGGIFAEINQPNVHAKEIVEFGQESIECIRQLDKEFGLELQIRVGINTGGPIVAGVLGTEKPTFEILGPAINMAQQMEHHGVPMQVHISRSVYELIYGGAFVIKERGQIEIKSGKVITYLVQEKEQ